MNTAVWRVCDRGEKLDLDQLKTNTDPKYCTLTVERYGIVFSSYSTLYTVHCTLNCTVLLEQRIFWGSKVAGIAPSSSIEVFFNDNKLSFRTTAINTNWQ